MSIFDATTIEIETTLLPKMRLNLGEQINAPQGALTKLIRPKVTVVQGNAKLASVAPAGDPKDGLPLKAIFVAGVAVLAVLALRRFWK